MREIGQLRSAQHAIAKRRWWNVVVDHRDPLKYRNKAFAHVDRLQ